LNTSADNHDFFSGGSAPDTRFLKSGVPYVPLSSVVAFLNLYPPGTHITFVDGAPMKDGETIAKTLSSLMTDLTEATYNPEVKPQPIPFSIDFDPDSPVDYYDAKRALEACNFDMEVTPVGEAEIYREQAIASVSKEHAPLPYASTAGGKQWCGISSAQRMAGKILEPIFS
jgi:hypothetical protein